MNATIDLDESLRALYFAPFPIVVLDQNRNVRMVNWSAEKLFVTTQAQCEGQYINHFVAPPSQQTIRNALAQSAERTRDGSRAPHLLTHVVLVDDEHRYFDAEIAISAWQPSDFLFSRDTALPVTPDVSDAHHGPILHDAYYTIGLRQTSDSKRDELVDVGAEAGATAQAQEELLERSVHSTDVNIYVVSSDGKRSAANPACRRFAVSRGLRFPDPLSGPLWNNTRIKVYDEAFEKPIPVERSLLYLAATKGRQSPETHVGWENVLTGERLHMRVSASPVHDKSGKLIGGMLCFVDVTERRKQNDREVKAKGEEYFKLVCDSMPQLVWTSLPDGFHDYYNKGWWEFTGLQPGDTMGIGWQHAFHPEDMPEVNRCWSHSLRTGEPYNVQYRCRRQDGAWRWMLGRALPLRDHSGNIIKWFGTCTDVHETVEALYASRKSQTQLASVINHANVTLWAVDTQGIITVAEGPGLRQLKLGGSPHASADGSAASTGTNRGNASATTSEVSDLSSAHTSARERTAQKQQPQPPHAPGGSHASERSHGGASVSRSTTTNNSQLRGNRGGGTSSPPVTMIGRSIYDLWDPEVKQHVERALRGDSVTREMELEGRWYRTSYTPIREREMYRAAADVMGESCSVVTGVVGASLDITEVKRAAQMMEEAKMEKLRAISAESAAKEANRLKGEFLANMSHEIRTPIAGVIGMSELLCATELNKEQRDYAENILRSGDALLTVLNDILDFSKIEIGKLDIENSPFRLDVVIQDTMKMLTFATQKKGLRFTQDIRLDGIEYVIGDGGRIRQVLTNLLTNAIKFTKEGSITLRAFEEGADENTTRVHFQIVDTGVGISTKQMSKLFRPFSQADSSTARRFGGTGLGLAISKNLVGLMKGDIGLDSEEGTGSTAWFVIPFQKARAPSPDDRVDPLRTYSPRDSIAPIIEPSPPQYDLIQAAKQRVITDHAGAQANSATPDGIESTPSGPAAAPQSQKSSKERWILVAEDNLMNQQIALQMIKKMGYQAHAVNNGREALSEIDNKPYELILMDCQMPEMDGYEATRLIRASGGSKQDIPIIAMTASAIRGDRERCLEAGMSDYLAKPVKRVTLETMIKKWMDNNIITTQNSGEVHSPQPLRPSAPVPSHSFAEVAARNFNGMNQPSVTTNGVHSPPTSSSGSSDTSTPQSESSTDGSRLVGSPDATPIATMAVPSMATPRRAAPPPKLTDLSSLENGHDLHAPRKSPTQPTTMRQ